MQWGGVKKKTKGLYKPWLIYNLLFILLHNLLFKIYVYSTEYGYSNRYVDIYNAHDYLSHIIRTLVVLDQPELMLPGYWFLQVMFLSFILFYVVRLVVKDSKGLLITFVLLYFISIVLRCFVDYKWIITKVIVADIYIVTGIVLKENWERVVKCFRPITVVLSITMVLLFYLFGPRMTMDSLKLNEFPIYYIISLTGSVGVIALSYILSHSENIKVLSRALSNVGKKTLPILTWHFTGFKFVTLLILLITGGEIKRLGMFPTLEGINYGIVWLYVIGGISVPLIIDKILSMMQKTVGTIKTE